MAPLLSRSEAALMAALRGHVRHPLHERPQESWTRARIKPRHSSCLLISTWRFWTPPSFSSPSPSTLPPPSHGHLSLPNSCHVFSPGTRLTSGVSRSAAVAPAESSTRRWFARARDPGDWSTSAEWWGIQGGGWGHDMGETVFREASDVGNGEVQVTAHASTAQVGDAEQLPARRPQDTWHFLGSQWRVLRFNSVTRQSVARVTALQFPLSPEEEEREEVEGGVVLRQQPDCLAFEYLKTAVSAGLSFASLAGLNLTQETPAQQSNSASSQSKNFSKRQLRVLCIGLGGGSLPLFLAHHLPGAQVDAVELDPTVISAAVNAMGFPPWSVQSRSSILSEAKGETPDRVLETGRRERTSDFTRGENEEKGVALQVGKERREMRERRTRNNTVQRQIWASIWGRLAVYEGDGGRFVEEKVEREEWGWSSSRSMENRSHDRFSKESESGCGYDLVFVDAYDGEDNVPRQLWNRHGNFLRSLARLVHPSHGTVVVNLHGNLPPPSLFERLTGNCHRGFDPSSEKGAVVQEICRAYRQAVLLWGIMRHGKALCGVGDFVDIGNVEKALNSMMDTLLGSTGATPVTRVTRGNQSLDGATDGSSALGMAFTVATPFQGNVALVVGRGGGQGETNVEALKREGKRVQRMLGIPFDVSFRAALGFHLVD